MSTYGAGRYGRGSYGYGDRVGSLASEAEYTLSIAFNENIAGVFTLASAVDGPDTITDVDVFAGGFDDVTADVTNDGYQAVFGTDNLMTAIQPANLTCRVSRPDDPGFWNPANPASPINSETPGFQPMRPALLTALLAGTTYSFFRGFLRHATWNSVTRSCELYFEDLLLWASRVYPTVASTGPIRAGAVVELLFALVDPLVVCDVDDGSLLDDFTADGTISVTQILSNVLAVDLGTVYIRGDGTPVYRANSTPLAAAPVATITVTRQTSGEQAGVDLDDIGTRVTVEKTDESGTVLNTWTAVNPVAERRFGRADISTVSSPYVQSGQALADELVLQGVDGKPPIQFTLGNVDLATAALIFTAEPLNVYTVEDDFGGSAGDGIAQQISHQIGTGLHTATFLMKARKTKAFTLVSALDGPDVLRYP